MDEAQVRQMIADAIQAERERIADIVQSTEVLGDYAGQGDADEVFVPDLSRTLQGVAQRILRPDAQEGS